MKTGCVLLAAGEGKRFGGEKLLSEVGGKSMIARALALYASVPFSCRVCVARKDDYRIQTLARDSGFAVVVNPDPSRGVGTSVSIGTEKALLMDPELDGILYAVSDQPYLERDSVLRVLDAFHDDPKRIVSLSCLGVRGNPAVFPRSCWNALMQLREDVGGGAVIRNNPEMLRLVEAGSAKELEDIDKRVLK